MSEPTPSRPSSTIDEQRRTLLHLGLSGGATWASGLLAGWGLLQPASEVVAATLGTDAIFRDGFEPGATLTPFRNARTGQRYATLAQAVAGSISGDTIKVAPGTYTVLAGPGEDPQPGQTYTGAGGIQLHTLTLEWEVPGVRPVLDLSAWAQAAGFGGQPKGLHAGTNNRNFTVRGLELIGSKNGSSYGIYSEGGYPSGNPVVTLTIEDCKLRFWADGVKTTYANRNMNVIMRRTTVEDCSGDSLTHGVYVQGDLLDVLGCTFRTTVAGNPTGAEFLGHLLKSRMARTRVRGSLFDMRGGGASCIEAPNGGDLEVYGNIILKYNIGSPSNPPIKYGFEENVPYINVALTGAPITAGNTIVGANGASGVVVATTNGNTRLYFTPTSGGTRFDVGGQNILVGGVVRATQVGSFGGSPDGVGYATLHRVRIGQNTVRNEQPSSWPGTTATAIGMLWVSPTMTDASAVPISNSSIVAAGFVRNNIVADIGTGNRTVANIAPEPQYADNSPVEAATVSTLAGSPGVYSGSSIAGSPALNDAQYQYAGEFTEPLPRTDTFRGGYIAGDPAWRVGQQANTWRVVSNSRIQDVDPAFNAALNPMGAGGDSPWRGSDGIKAVIDAWGTAAWDEANLRLWLPLNGGHGNYAGNEAYYQPLGDASPNWVLADPPSGSLVYPAANLADGLESTGAYSDGRPRSIHPYCNVTFAPGVGSVITRMSAPFSNSNVNTHFAWCRDLTTGVPRRVFDFADPAQTGNPGGSSTYGAGAGGAIGAACCYDSKRNRVVSIGIGSNVHVLWCTPSASPGMWSGGHLSSAVFVSGGSIIQLLYIPDPIDRYLALTHWLGNLEHKLINPVTGAMTDLGPLSAGLASGFAREPGGACGAAWASDLGKVVLWNQASNAAQISTLTPHPSTPLTSAWTAGALTVGASNVVTPPVQGGNGTHGLFGHSARLRGCYLIVPDNLGGSRTHFYATSP